LIEDDGDVRWVIPIDEKNLLAIGVRQHVRLQNLVAKEYGFEKYLDYLKPRMKSAQRSTVLKALR
jgi:hypothetical protein